MKSHLNSLQEKVQPAKISLASPELAADSLEATLASEPFTDEEVRDFTLMDTTLRKHNSYNIMRMFYDDMQRKYGFANDDELVDRYIKFKEVYSNAQQ